MRTRNRIFKPLFGPKPRPRGDRRSPEENKDMIIADKLMGHVQAAIRANAPGEFEVVPNRSSTGFYVEQARPPRSRVPGGKPFLSISVGKDGVAFFPHYKGSAAQKELHPAGNLATLKKSLEAAFKSSQL